MDKTIKEILKDTSNWDKVQYWLDCISDEIQKAMLILDYLESKRWVI